MVTRRRLAHLTTAQCRARSRKGWETRRAGLTPEQLAHHKAVYNTGIKNRLVRQGKCRSCCRKREPSRRQFTQCVRCATVNRLRMQRTVRRWIPRSQMRTAA